MSAYENYSETSKKYDNARFALAAPELSRVVAALSASLRLPPNELVALDLGCGTGNYCAFVPSRDHLVVQPARVRVHRRVCAGHNVLSLFELS